MILNLFFHFGYLLESEYVEKGVEDARYPFIQELKGRNVIASECHNKWWKYSICLRLESEHTSYSDFMKESQKIIVDEMKNHLLEAIKY